MPRISRYNHDTHRLEWVDASEAEYDAWRVTRTRTQNAGTGTRSHKRKPAAPVAAGATDTLEGGPAALGTAAEAVGAAARATSPKRGKGSGGSGGGAGPLTPFLGLFSRVGAIGMVTLTARLTAGRHPMNAPEAVGVAAPALRILNRELGKRVSIQLKGGENARDLEQLGTGLVTWILRGFAGGQAGQFVAGQAPAQPQPAQAVADYPGYDPLPDDAATAAPDVADDSDLYSGSEPVLQGSGIAGGRAGFTSRQPTATAGPPGAAVNVPDSFWNSFSPPEVGLAEVMA